MLVGNWLHLDIHQSDTYIGVVENSDGGLPIVSWQASMAKHILHGRHARRVRFSIARIKRADRYSFFNRVRAACEPGRSQVQAPSLPWRCLPGQVVERLQACPGTTKASRQALGSAGLGIVTTILPLA